MVESKAMTRRARWRAARIHLLLVALLYALVVPVAFKDRRELLGSGGDWVKLDLRGLYVAIYLMAAGLCVTIVLVHMAVKQLGQRLSFGLVVACLFGPALMVPIGSAIYAGQVRALDERLAHAKTTTANALADAIRLRWALVPGQDPPQFEVELLSSVPVEVLYVAVMGSAASQHGDFIRSGSGREDPPAFQLRPGVPRRMTLTLDHSPTNDTYWSIYCSLAANGTTVGVNWHDPSQEAFGGDATRSMPLH